MENTEVSALDFEKNIAAIEEKIIRLKQLELSEGLNIDAEVSRLQEKLEHRFKHLYTRLTPWQKTLVARHPARPHCLDYVNGLIEDFELLCGDRAFADDPAMVGGIGRFRGQAVIVIGQEKGNDLESRVKYNFGMAKPEGYRKAQRLMDLADKFRLPVIAFVDTSGAFPGVEAEERGQAEAIAAGIERCLKLKVPFISVVIGEGGSGGAIAIATANRILMLEHAIYSVISPEGCASILWRSADKVKEATEALCLTAQDLRRLGVIDEIIAEPAGGAQRHHGEMISRVGEVIGRHLKELQAQTGDELKKKRTDKFLKWGGILQNLNNFLLDNIGVLAAALLLILAAHVLFLFFRRGKSDIKELLLQTQGELAGRLAALNEAGRQEQSRLVEALNEQKLAVLRIMDEKLLAVTKSVGEGLQQNTVKTNETLTDLRERLAKIDAAQQKISSLSEQVVSLQEVLSNKQARGAFGEIQLNDLVTAALPPNAYSFQALLGNGKKADCLLNLPNPPGAIVIDAKFPLESYQALRQAQTDRDKLEAERFFRVSVLKHIKDIAEKYIVAGETAESALMFLPSEAVYAELHANFIDVVEASYKAKVWIVSPTTLMATLNTVRAILKDAHMREQAGVIQKEVASLFDDICRLDERVENLGRHFKQAGDDIEAIKVSSGKINRRVQKIEAIELGEEERPALAHLAANE